MTASSVALTACPSGSVPSAVPMFLGGVEASTCTRPEDVVGHDHVVERGVTGIGHSA